MQARAACELELVIAGIRLTVSSLRLRGWRNHHRHARFALFFQGRATDRDTLTGRCSGQRMPAITKLVKYQTPVYASRQLPCSASA